MEFVSSADYEVIDRNPLEVEVGQRLKLGPKDPAWEGWIWAAADDGRASYVPEAILEVNWDGTAVAMAKFHARDLSVKRGEMVVSLNEVKGWHWCRKSDGSEGWLPGYILKPRQD